MRFKTLAFSTLFTCSLLLTIGMSYGYERAIEAEKADAIEAPMVVADDDAASDGQFVWMEGPAATGGGGEGWVEYNIHIPAPGIYALWGKVLAWDGNSDSFWVTWQPMDPDENAQETQNTEFRWGVAAGAAWHWDRINHWLDGGTFDREWKFKAAGETVLRIGVREDATMIDAIFVTNNLKANEGDLRLPTDKDRKIQVEGLAVDAKGKAATTWGSLKQAYE